MFPFQLRGEMETNVKTEQLATHKRNIELLKKAEGIHPQRARMDMRFLQSKK
ncbi:MAG: hypothetical protein M9887_00570 [Chitinophagales bacterium]|nr:hypothetical protein [Chitinophagales bacterium]